MRQKILEKRYSMSVIGSWIMFLIATIAVIALLAGRVIPLHEFWIPIIPLATLFIFASAATYLENRSNRPTKIGLVGIWTVIGITTIIFTALLLSNEIGDNEVLITMIPIGTLFILAIVFTILEYLSAEIRFCPKCEKILEKNWEFCESCGIRLILRCPSCAKKLKGNPKYCHKCGLNLSEIELSQNNRTPPKSIIKRQSDSCDHCGAPTNPEAIFCGYCGEFRQ